MKEPVDHILRPKLPWRTNGFITECGYNAESVKTITREEFFKRVKDLGQQRTAMLMCMTCSDTARRWGTWEEDARKAMEREITWETRSMGYYMAVDVAVRLGRATGGYPRDSDGHRLLDELHAIAKLINAHPEEFARLVQEIGAAREWNAKKLELASKKDRVKPH